MQIDVPAIQLIAYTALTLSGVAVAGAAASFTYWNHVGFAPVVVFTMGGWKPEKIGPDCGLLALKFEIWNRRKYPIVIRAMQLFLPTRTMTDPAIPLDEDFPWQICLPPGFDEESAMYSRPGNVVAPNSFEGIISNIPVLNRKEQEGSVPEHDEEVQLIVQYFDPRANREVTLKAVYKFRYHHF